MPRKNLDPLDQLLLDARRVAFGTKEHRSKLSRHVRAVAAEIAEQQRQLYLNPKNWLPGDILRIILIEGDSEVSIGIFQELLHRSVPRTRRFVPASSDAIPIREERVHGSYWQTPAAPVEVFETPRERRAIVERAAELLLEAS